MIRQVVQPLDGAAGLDRATERPPLSEMLDRIAAGIPVEGMESLAPALLDGSDSLELLVDTLPRTETGKLQRFKLREIGK